MSLGDALVKSLRSIPDAQASISVQKLGREAADEIERLRASQAKVVEALRDIEEIAIKNGVEDLAMGDLLDDMDEIARICERALAEHGGQT